jgi:hypothetical protein
MAWLRTKIGFAPAPLYSQPHFRIRSGDAVGLNVDSGWAAALDTNASIDAETNFRIRFEVEELNNVARGGAGEQFYLQWRKNGGPWSQILAPGFPSATSTPAVAVIESAQYAHLDATTNLLAGSGKTFQAGIGSETGVTNTLSGFQNEHTEFEFCLRIRRFYDGGRNDAGDVFEFRLVVQTDVPFAGTYVLPAVTLTIPAGLIGGTLVETPSKVGPFKDGNGNLYYLHERAETNNVWLVSKSTDGGDTWVDVDTVNRPTKGDLEAVDAVLENDRLYILHCQSPAVWHHVFRVSTHGTDPDTWELKDEEIEPNSVPDQVPSRQVAGIVRRGDGDLVAFYIFNNGTNTQVYYKIKPNGGSWGSRIQLDSEAVNFLGLGVVRGASDKSHIAYNDDAGNVWHRSLDSADTLSARESLTTAGLTGTTDNDLTPPVYWDEAGTEKVLVIYAKSDGKLYSRIITNDGAPGTESSAATDNTIQRNKGSSHAVCATIAVDGPDVHLLYADLTTEDIWFDSNLDEAGWGTDVEELDATACHNITGQIFTHSGGNGGAKVFGYVYEDGTDGYTGGLKYRERVFGASPQTITPSAIASAEAFGTAKVNQRVVAAGIASAEAFGTAKVNQQIRPSGIASAEACGAARVNQSIACTGIASAEVFGSTRVNQQIRPSAISSTEAFGTAAVHQQIRPGGIASGEAFGAATVLAPQTITVSSIASAEAFGTAKVQQQVRVSGIDSAEAFGTARLNQQIRPGAIASAEAFGTPIVSVAGANQTITPSSITSAEAFGTTKLNQQIRPSAISSTEAFGAPRVNQQIRPSAIASAEAFGTARLNQQIRPSGIASSETFGTHVVSVGGGAQTIVPTGIASAEVFGTARLNQQIRPSSVPSGEAFGTTKVSSLRISPTGIPSGEVFGSTRVTRHLVPGGIASLEAFGTARISQQIRASSVPSAEAFGTLQLLGVWFFGDVVTASGHSLVGPTGSAQSLAGPRGSAISLTGSHTEGENLE